MRTVLAIAALAWAAGANASEGGITVEAGGAGISMEVTRFDPERCVLVLEPKGNAFVLKAQSKFPAAWFRKGCEARLKAAAPVPSPVRADARAGSALFDGLSGRAHAHAEAGIDSIVKS
ncbi:MAG: hypothetical protein HYX59_05640 [Elusimicrobia bacterium]|nr:hypothetical protein [Elusimicrobiota bacterium]